MTSYRRVGAYMVLTLVLSTPSLAGAPSETDVRRLLDAGHYREGREKARERLDALIATGGEEAPVVLAAWDVWLEAVLLDGTWEIPADVERAEWVVQAREAGRGPDDVRLADSLRNLAQLRQAARQDLTEVLGLFERAHDLAARDAGPASGKALEIAALLTQELSLSGRLEQADALAEAAVAASQQRPGDPHPALAELLVTLASHRARTYHDFDGARSRIDRALEIQLRLLEPGHPALAGTYLRLGALAFFDSDTVQARNHWEHGLEILNSAQKEGWATSPRHRDSLLLNLGLVRWRHGDLRGAMELFALAEPPERPACASCGDDNIAELAIEMGDFESARTRLHNILEAQRRYLEPGDARTPRVHWRLGKLYLATGDLEAAREHLDIALRGNLDNLGPLHSRTARNYREIGHLEEADGNLALAIDFLERAREIYEAALGAEHQLTALTRVDLDRLLWRSGRLSGLIDRSLETAAVLRRHVQETARFLSEREALLAEAQRLPSLDLPLALAVRGAGDAADRVWEEIIRARALVLDEIGLRHRASLDAGTGEVADRRQRLEAAKRQTARLEVRAADAVDPEAHHRMVAEARAVQERLEQELAAHHAASAPKPPMETVSLAALREALPEDAALVGYVEYDLLPQSSAPEVRSYLAFVLVADRSTAVVPLGEAGTIERLVRRWRAEAGDSSGGVEAEARYRESGRALRRALWDPLRPHISSVRRVLMVPDGAIHLVSFATLPSDSTGYLVEQDPRFHYISVERDLLTLREERRVGRGLLAIGGPDFDARRGERVVPAPLAERGVYRGIRSACESLGTLRFAPLPSSLDEVRELRSLWTQRTRKEPVRLLTGAGASEASFKLEAPGHRVVHVATHGFAFDGVCDTVASSRSAHDGPGGGRRVHTAESPLLLSGLALAGANRRLEAGAEEEDGMLTADEVATLDLRGVEWAVLSGCETGIGRIVTGEGVLGLRRAFRVAGSRTLIASLWPVEDHATREWIAELYRARGGGASTDEAITRAGRTILSARRRAGLSTHPASWGAFVASGDWR